MISGKEREQIAQAIQAAGDPAPLESIHPVSGGSISRTFRVETNNRRYMIKMHETAPADFFQKEAEGLRLLKHAGELGVPHVFYVDKHSIVMEWVEGLRAPDTDEKLGRGLARLHRDHTSSQGFGLSFDNYIGQLPQPNGWQDDWLTFLREKRLGFQAELAVKQGCFSRERGKKMERLLQSLDQWIDPQQVRPSLLHGDLWGGNWICGPDGVPYLIDPAVFYGDREFDLAFSEMFGGFSSAFYQAYREEYPLSPGYEERKPLYQLYYLLVHLNLFGESYGPSVDRILRRYGG